jgi:hypothetical protein
MNPDNTINLDLMAATLVSAAQHPSVDFYHSASDVCIGVSPVPFMTEEGEDGQEHRHYALIVYGPKEKLAGTQEAAQFAEAAIGLMITHSCAVSIRVLKEPQELETGVRIYPIVAVVPFLSLPADNETAH